MTIVGDVVNLRKELNWYEKKPMFGHRVLVTREHSGGFESLEELGAEVIQFSTIEIVPPENWDELDRAIDTIESYDWLIFTSSNGVKYFFSRLFERGRDIRELKGLKICAIGQKTAASIGKFGIRVDLVPESFNAEGLIEAFAKEVRSTDGVTPSVQVFQGHEGSSCPVRRLQERYFLIKSGNWEVQSMCLLHTGL